MKIPYDGLTLKATTSELQGKLTGGRIQRVMQPRPLDLVLSIRRDGSNHSLVLSADAIFSRTHLTVLKLQNPPEPPAFCMICRKHLEGGVVTSIEQRGFDRILEINVNTSGREHLLIAELMGKHSNIVLVSESSMVLDAIKRISRKKSRLREMLPGAPYVSPPSPVGVLSPFDAAESELLDFADPSDTESTSARLMSRFEGLSPFLARELVLRTELSSVKDAWREIFGAASEGAWMPVVIRGSDHRPIGAYPFPTIQANSADQHERDSMNTALDQYFASAMPRAELDSAIHALLSELDRALKARQKKAESLRRSLAEAGRAEEHKQNAELILANVNSIEEGSESVKVADFNSAGEPPRVIALDSRLSAVENAESYYRRYRKAKDSAESQKQFQEVVEREIARLSEGTAAAGTADSVDEIQRIRRSLTESGSLRDAPDFGQVIERRNRFQGKKIRTLTTPEGWEVMYGENSEANDFLTRKVASPNDLWLHVRASSSAHVVIRTRNEPAKVPASVIKRAAIVAAQHSGSKHSSTVPVDYTLKKYVRRPRGGAPGAVLYQNEKTIHVSPKAGE